MASSDSSGNSSQRPVRPTRLRAEDLSGMTMRDFYPNRNDRETNTLSRMDTIQHELDTLFSLPRSSTPHKDDYPILHHELPTLWAMIEEKKFKFWDSRDQEMLKQMIRLRVQVLQNAMTDEDAEKDMGISLAQRYIYPKTGGRH